jgi:transketolase
MSEINNEKKYEKADTKKILGTVFLEAARKNPAFVLVSTDSGGRSGFGDFIKEFPQRYFELGIMEAAAISVSAGLATAGKIPVFCAPAPFVTVRPMEMFKIDLGYMAQNVKVIARNCGFNYADLGPTHYGLEDYGTIRLIPNIVILAPEDSGELEAAFKTALEYNGPVYLRMSSAPLPKIFPEEKFEIGRGRLIREGKDLTIFSTGEVTVNAAAAVEALAAKGISAELIGLPTINPLDKDIILNSVAKTRRAVTVEEHFITGGLGTAISEVLSESCPCPLKKIGVPHVYISSGPYGDMMRNFGLDVEGIEKSVLEFVSK